ncbi:hypothetical protein ACVINI_005799 [Rhizobium beringeri]|nr:hypothetical protein [Rhizobium leguminosarum]
MSTDNAMKISADHLRRDAFLYVRQSSLRQVFENTESTKRQYALRDRVHVALADAATDTTGKQDLLAAQGSSWTKMAFTTPRCSTIVCCSA